MEERVAEFTFGIRDDNGLMLIRIVDCDGVIMYEIENARGYKRYFVHKGTTNCTFTSTVGMSTIFGNKKSLGKMIYNHNYVVIHELFKGDEVSCVTNVCGLYINTPQDDKELKEWIICGRDK